MRILFGWTVARSAQPALSLSSFIFLLFSISTWHEDGDSRLKERLVMQCGDLP